MKKAISLLILTATVFNSCKRDCRDKDDKLTFQRTNYQGTLRTDGCYYRYHPEYYTPTYSIIFLYKNGVVLGENTEDLEDYDSYATGSRQGSKPKWGAFKEENGIIRMETWHARKCEYPVYVQSGTVLNDSTFIIWESYRAINTEDYTSINDTFHFKQTPSKPDSTQPYL